MSHPPLILKTSSQITPELLKRLFIFRHAVFVERLGWVPPRGGEEVDFFDTLNPLYAISQDGNGHIVAAARLLPMNGPSMLRDVFPSLLDGAPCPSDETVWEISRFALRPTPGDRTGHRRALLALVERLFDVALSRGVRRLIAVSDQRLERLVAETTGLPIHRLAPPQRMGNDWVVAGWTEVSSAARSQLAERAHADRPWTLSRPAA